MALPTVQVLLDDGTGTFPHDITGKSQLLPGYSIKRGRQDELSQVTPGDMQIVLDNNDGRFTLGSTIIASPSPIRPGTKIRVKVTANAVTVNRFTGAMQGLPVDWPSGSDQESRVRITAVDAQARAERRPLRSVVEEEIVEDAPVVYYTLGEPEGAIAAADSSGNQGPALTMAGTGAAVVFGTDTGPGTDGLTAATFAGGKWLTSGVTVAASGGVAECFFSRTGNPAVLEVVLAFTVGMSGSVLVVMISPSGRLTTNGADFGASPVVTDGLVHHVSWSSGSLLLDGVDLGVPIAGPPDGRLLVGGVVPGFELGGTPLGTFTGAISHVAVFSSLSTARAAQHSAAGASGFAGESGTARLTRLASYANLPVGTLDTSLTNVAFRDITGSNVADQLREVADAEMGIVFFDGSGNLTFHNRNRAPAKTAADITIAANQLAEDTSFAVDMQGVINYFETTAAGTQVTQVVRDTLSELGDGTATNPGYGRYPDSRSYLVQTDAEALDRANWIVGTHAEPLPRAGTLKVDVLTLTAAQQAAVLAIEPNTWVRVTGLPSQTPGGTTADLMVQGWSEVLNGSEWSLTLNVVARSLFSPVWILGDATAGVLGTTTRLYV